MKRRVFVAFAALSALVAALVPVVGAPPARAVVDHRNVPTQYVAKLFTEAWGRAPTPTLWQQILDNFHANGCSVTTTKYWGEHFYKHANFTSAYPLSGGGHVVGARIEAFARGVLNQEPDIGFYNSLYTTQMGTNTETTWSNIVTNVLSGTAFSSFVTNTICPTAGELNRKDPAAYGWNETAVEPLMGNRHHSAQTCGLGTGTTQTQLQNALNLAAGSTNKVVLLRQGAEIYIDGINTGGAWPPPTGGGVGLTIPAGVTLRTCKSTDANGAGLPSPGPTAYALQGRLVRRWNRAPSPDVTWHHSSLGYSPTVRVDSGARLENVWVDGGRNGLDNFCDAAIGWCYNVWVIGGAGTTHVTGNRFDNSAGSTMVHVGGSIDGDILSSGIARPCTATHYVTSNVFTGYASRHLDYPTPTFGDGWQDAISAYCEQTDIGSNAVVDATDVSIIVFRTCTAEETWYCPTGMRAQQSDVHDNVVVNGGNSVYGAIWLSPLDFTHTPAYIADFTGTTVTNNHMWTGWNAIMDGLIMVGIRMNKPICNPGDTSCGPTGHPGYDANQTRRGTGGSISNNDTSGQLTYTEVAIGISGMTNVSVTNNPMTGSYVAGPGTGGLPTTFPAFSCKTDAAGSTAPILREFTDVTGGFFGNGYWASGTISGNSAPVRDRDMIYRPYANQLPAGCITGANLG